MAAADDDGQYDAELGELRENVKNLGECLSAVLARIEGLESKKRPGAATQVETNNVDAPAMTFADAVAGKKGEPTVTTKRSEHVETTPDGGTKTQVRVETHETSGDVDGTKSTKRLHLTERVITTKTFQTMASPDCEFKLPPYLNEWKMNSVDIPEHEPEQPLPTLVGMRRKKNDAQLGLTLNEHNGQLFVDELADDSPLVKQGLLHVGDTVLAVNGQEVTTKAAFERALQSAGAFVCFKIVPSGLDSPPPDGSFIKAYVDYEPDGDESIPCKDIGLRFRAGDILQVVSKDDPNWWHARKVNDMSLIGLIPSPTQQQSRKTSAGTGLKGAEQPDMRVYEEVAKLSPYGRRVLILLGAPGVGRRTLKAMMLRQDRGNFATVTPYTSRPKRGFEQEGREYHFVKKERMQRDIDQGQFVEWGEYNGNLYGTTVHSVRQVTKSGRMCVLDCSPQAVKYLHTSEFMPYIVFIAPPSFDELQQLYQVHPNRTKSKSESDMRKTCDESARLESQYQQLFDLSLVNRNVDVTFRRLLDALELLKGEPQWVPASWIS